MDCKQLMIICGTLLVVMGGCSANPGYFGPRFRRLFEPQQYDDETEFYPIIGEKRMADDVGFARKSLGVSKNSKVHQFLCTMEEAKSSCPMGGKGPVVLKKVNVNLSVCVCYCSSGYKEDKGCLD